jgi:hypothetical protein
MSFNNGKCGSSDQIEKYFFSKYKPYITGIEEDVPVHVNPRQPKCVPVDFCNEDSELSFCVSSGLTPPAAPAPAKDVRRQ